MNKHFLLIAGFAVGLSTTAHASQQLVFQCDTGTHIIQCIRADLVQTTPIGTKIRLTHFNTQNDFVC